MARILLALLCALALARGALADTGVERLHAFLADVHSLRASFDQTLYDENMKELDRSQGVMYIERPDRFRWDYTKPYRQIIVSDGRDVWIYDVELAQVTVRPLTAAVGSTPASLLSSGRPIEDTFHVQGLGTTHGLAWVGLEPRSKETSFTGVRLGFDEHGLRSMELKDSFGQTTELVFHDVARNPKLDPQLFRFKPPEGVDVIRDTGGQ